MKKLAFHLAMLTSLCISLNLSAAEQTATLKRFEDYPVQTRYAGKPAKVDFASNPDMKTFRTRLKEGIRDGVNFAGAYTIVEIGCGSSCQALFILETGTGKFVDQITACMGNFHQIDSRLLIVNPPEEDVDYPPLCPVEQYVLENGKMKAVE